MDKPLKSCLCCIQIKSAWVGGDDLYCSKNNHWKTNPRFHEVEVKIKWEFMSAHMEKYSVYSETELKCVSKKVKTFK